MTKANRQSSRHGRWMWAFIVESILVVIMLATFIPIAIRSNSVKMTISTSYGTGVTLEAEKDGSIEYEEVLDLMYADNFIRGGMIQWLSGKHIYSFDDPALARALSTRICEPFPSDDLSARLKAEQECAGKSGIKELRELASEHQLPFHRVGMIVEIGIPGSIQETGRAYACYGSGYLGETIRLVNQGDYEKQTTVEIDPKGRYSCKIPSAPDIQLNEKDAPAVVDPFIGPKEEALAIVVE